MLQTVSKLEDQPQLRPVGNTVQQLLDILLPQLFHFGAGRRLVRRLRAWIGGQRLHIALHRGVIFVQQSADHILRRALRPLRAAVGSAGAGSRPGDGEP